MKAGTILSNKYCVTSLIGSGGMGEVWLGENLALRAPVAIKVLRGDLLTENARARFLQEARAAASLRSTHVVQIFDFGIHENVPYIVMEYLKGETLRARLDRVGRIPLWDVAYILKHAARAVAMAHDAGVIHRDLKPDNLFIVVEEDHEVVKVLDFGVAKVQAPIEEKTPSIETASGALIGTPCYMSPEQLRGSHPVDARTDVWALGVIAYQAVTGKLPFNGATAWDLAIQICTGIPPKASELVELPAGFDAWFDKCVMKDREQRFAGAREVAAELEKIAGDDRPATRPPEPRPASVPIATELASTYRRETPALSVSTAQTTPGLEIVSRSDPLRAKDPTSRLLRGLVILAIAGGLATLLARSLLTTEPPPPVPVSVAVPVPIAAAKTATTSIPTVPVPVPVPVPIAPAKTAALPRPKSKALTPDAGSAAPASAAPAAPAEPARDLLRGDYQEPR